jgi:hypothetical protein
MWIYVEFLRLSTRPMRVFECPQPKKSLGELSAVGGTSVGKRMELHTRGEELPYKMA